MQRGRVQGYDRRQKIRDIGQITTRLNILCCKQRSGAYMYHSVSASLVAVREVMTELFLELLLTDRMALLLDTW